MAIGLIFDAAAASTVVILGVHGGRDGMRAYLRTAVEKVLSWN
jgi:hypothetical protein